MAYLVVDRCGTERIFQEEPTRKLVYWTIEETMLSIPTDCVCLPKGSI